VDEWTFLTIAEKMLVVFVVLMAIPAIVGAWVRLIEMLRDFGKDRGADGQ
jgi:hypothetical protein